MNYVILTTSQHREINDIWTGSEHILDLTSTRLKQNCLLKAALVPYKPKFKVEF